MARTATRAPSRASMLAALSARSLTTPAPTLPSPRSPTPISRIRTPLIVRHLESSFLLVESRSSQRSLQLEERVPHALQTGSALPPACHHPGGLLQLHRPPDQSARGQ